MSPLCRATLLCLAFAPACPATPPIARFQTQKRDATTYFLVAIKPPKDLAMPEPPGLHRVETNRVEDFYFPAASEAARRAVMQVPRLDSLDGRITAVYFAGSFDGELLFVGKRAGDEATASCRLFYPVEAKRTKGLAALPGDRGEKDVGLTIAWKNAESINVPTANRDAMTYPASEDLQGRHAWAQAMWFGRMELRAPHAGLFGVSRLLTGHKYDVWAAPLERATATTRLPTVPPASAGSPDLFSLITGAAHLDEAVMLRRLQEPKAFETYPRTVAVDSLPKVTLAEHDWKKMMAGKNPNDEPLAKLVPHDCYFLTTTSLTSFASAWDVLDAWGGSVLRPPQASDRDHGLRARYERQLCLSTARLRYFLSSKGFESAALIGSDLYWTEGSDVTVLFDPSDKKHFLATLTTLVEETTKPFGAAVKGTRKTHRGITIDGWRTPRREISAYRAEVGGFIVCSNSPVAIRRVIDAHASKLTALADSLDFRYMRTVFHRDAKDEDGFVFLSDAFIRRLVNAPTRIKAARRQQARATLALASHAALFAGHETGKLPADTAALLHDSGLEASSLTVPDGKSIVWDGSRKQAVSEVYGTLEQGTPLLELSIDKVTRPEEEAFRAFHTEYLRAWSGFFDPVGIRFDLAAGKTKVDIFILPLINSQEYASLRSLAGGGLLRHDFRTIPANTAFQLLMHLDNPNNNAGLGDWFLLHLGGKGLKLDRWVQSWIANDLYPGRGAGINAREEFSSSRLTLGLGVEDAEKWESAIRTIWTNHLKPRGKANIEEYLYRKHRVERLPIQSERIDGLIPFLEMAMPALPRLPSGRLNKPMIHRTVIDKGYYLSFSRKAIEDRIDHALGIRKAKLDDPQGVHAAVYFAPPGGQAERMLTAYFDWSNHVKAQSALAHWEGLYAGGLVTATMTPSAREDAVRRMIGYVPVSPDGTALAWQAKEGRIANDHHGTLAAPTFRAKLPADAPLAKLLRSLRSVQAGLRFREDGLHTTITLDWGRE